MRRAIPLLALAPVLAAGGCGNSTPHTTASHTPTAATTAGQPTKPAALEQAVREAIGENHRVSIEALWTNRVPANPPATAGPALAYLRESVAQRRRQGIRVRVLNDKLHVLGVQLEPSYTAATATIVDVVKVQPSYPDGRPRGRSVATHEHARLQLRRIGDSQRFVVWKVTLG